MHQYSGYWCFQYTYTSMGGYFFSTIEEEGGGIQSKESITLCGDWKQVLLWTRYKCLRMWQIVARHFAATDISNQCVKNPWRCAALRAECTRRLPPTHNTIRSRRYWRWAVRWDTFFSSTWYDNLPSDCQWHTPANETNFPHRLASFRSPVCRQLLKFS